MRFIISLGVLLFLSGITLTAFAQNGNLAGQIDDIYAEMGEAVKAKDAAAVASFFADDVFFKLPGQQPVNSRMAVEEIHEGMFSQGLSVRMETTDLQEYGNIAIEVGSADIIAPDGSVVSRTTYLTNWKKINGKWLIFRDVISALPAE
jgi:uncharacterized protein (TIGR02246 family)